MSDDEEDDIIVIHGEDVMIDGIVFRYLPATEQQDAIWSAYPLAYDVIPRVHPTFSFVSDGYYHDTFIAAARFGIKQMQQDVKKARALVKLYDQEVGKEKYYVLTATD